MYGLIVVLGIVYNTKTRKILIGLRKKDILVEKLSWAFPGGKPEESEAPECAVAREIKEETNLDAEVKQLILSRTPEESEKLFLNYYFCTTEQTKTKPNEFKKLKWIKPNEVEKYFTTSIHPKILEFLKALS